MAFFNFCASHFPIENIICFYIRVKRLKKKNKKNAWRAGEEKNILAQLLLISPVTMKMMRSQMLVTRSAMRSRLWLTQIR